MFSNSAAYPLESVYCFCQSPVHRLNSVRIPNNHTVLFCLFSVLFFVFVLFCVLCLCVCTVLWFVSLCLYCVVFCAFVFVLCCVLCLCAGSIVDSCAVKPIRQ